MLKGISSNWKQPVAFHFVKDSASAPEIVRTIKEIVRNAKKSGFKVVSLVCDQGTNNVKAIKSLLDETRSKYVRQNLEMRHRVIEIDDEKIIPLFDTPHLLKGMRNTLLKHNIQFHQDGILKTAK